MRVCVLGESERQTKDLSKQNGKERKKSSKYIIKGLEDIASFY